MSLNCWQYSWSKTDDVVCVGVIMILRMMVGVVVVVVGLVVGVVVSPFVVVEGPGGVEMVGV